MESGIRKRKRSHGNRNGICNTESVKEGSKRSVEKKNISNDNKINKQIKKAINE